VVVVVVVELVDVVLPDPPGGMYPAQEPELAVATTSTAVEAVRQDSPGSPTEMFQVVEVTSVMVPLAVPEAV
jgi:hypothetical protein